MTKEEIGCWNCILDGVKSGEPVCPDCGTEIAHNCKKYRHEKVAVEKSEIKKRDNYGNFCIFRPTCSI